MCSQWKRRNIEWAVQTPRIVLYFVLNEEGTRSSAAQRNRAMLHVVAYIAKLFKITQGHHSKWERNPYFVSRIVSEIFSVNIWYDLEIWVSVTEGHLKRRKKNKTVWLPDGKTNLRICWSSRCDRIPAWQTDHRRTEGHLLQLSWCTVKTEDIQTNLRSDVTITSV